MKNIFLLFALMTSSVLFFTACDKDDDTTEDMHEHEHEHEHEGEDTDFAYHAHITAPTSTDGVAENRHVGDSLQVTVNFESHTGETVHHVNVRVYNEADNSIELLNAPSEAHVHATDGEYVFSQGILLDVEAHSNWIIEAKVWGNGEGVGETMETVKFHVHP